MPVGLGMRVFTVDGVLVNVNVIAVRLVGLGALVVLALMFRLSVSFFVS